MNRLILTAAVLALLGVHTAMAQGPPARSRGQVCLPPVERSIDARANNVTTDDQQTLAEPPVRTQLRDSANCPRADQRGCGDPRQVRQHKWCGREPGTTVPSPARRDRARAVTGRGPGGGAATCCGYGCCARCCWACATPPRRVETSEDASTSVDAKTTGALRAALLDERRAQAFYESVMAKHGRVRPFANIVNAERRHEAAVIALMEHHDVAVPSPELGELPAVPETLRECNLLAARLERDNIALYDKLLVDIAAPDIRAVFENLRAASKDNHLPAFERWAGGSAAPRIDRVYRGGRRAP